MALRDGDGWVECQCGAKHWGLNGASGIVLLNPESRSVLLQLRAEWTHGGRVWGIPGGARDSHETAIESAMREMYEEMQIPAEQVLVVHDELWTDHGDWHYHTVIATVAKDVAYSHNEEAERCEWVPISEVSDLDLHPGFASTWHTVHEVLENLLKSSAN